MFHNAKHSPTRAVPAQAFGAPIAGAAPQVDLAHHSLPDQIRRIGRNHFTYELMPGRPAEIVIAALKFQIRVADSA
jgi:hypothetical protein